MENIKDKAKQDLTDLINTKSELNAFNEAYNKAKTSEEAPSLTTEENLYSKNQNVIERIAENINNKDYLSVFVELLKKEDFSQRNVNLSELLNELPQSVNQQFGISENDKKTPEKAIKELDKLIKDTRDKITDEYHSQGLVEPIELQKEIDKKMNDIRERVENDSNFKKGVVEFLTQNRKEHDITTAGEIKTLGFTEKEANDLSLKMMILQEINFARENNSWHSITYNLNNNDNNAYLKEITHNITDVEKVNLANALREHKWSSSENKQTTEKKHQIADFLTLQVLQKESINDFKGNVLNTVAENEREKTKERFGEKQDIYEERTKKLLGFIPFGKEKMKTGEEIIVRDQEAKQYIENLTKFIQNKQGKSEDLLHITNSFNPNSNVSKAIIEQTAKVQSEQIGTVFGEKENLPETLSEILHNQQTFSEYAKSFNENSLAKATLDRLKEPEKKDRKLDLAETNNGLNRAMERKDTTVNAVANKVKADELNTQAQKIELSTKFAQVYGKIETQNSEQRKTTQNISNSRLKM